MGLTTNKHSPVALPSFTTRDTHTKSHQWCVEKSSDLQLKLRAWMTSLGRRGWKWKAEKVGYPKSHFLHQMAGISLFCHCPPSTLPFSPGFSFPHDISVVWWKIWFDSSKGVFLAILNNFFCEASFCSWSPLNLCFTKQMWMLMILVEEQCGRGIFVWGLHYILEDSRRQRFAVCETWCGLHRPEAN